MYPRAFIHLLQIKFDDNYILKDLNEKIKDLNLKLSYNTKIVDESVVLQDLCTLIGTSNHKKNNCKNLIRITGFQNAFIHFLDFNSNNIQSMNTVNSKNILCYITG